jgi:hypothetical protein
MKALLIAASYVVAVAIGFALGIYTLPILVAPTGLSAADVEDRAQSSLYKGQFRRNLKGSDFLHWGEGIVYVDVGNITLHGEVSPGPDYKLYLSPEFVETEDDFDRVKPRMTRLGDVRVFKNFSIPVPSGVDVNRYNTVIVWCETFHQFISAAKYR